VFHVTFDRFDKIGYQVMAPGQLDIDLRKGILDAIPAVDQAVVNADCPEDYRSYDREEYQE
jgi:hypothetical protein